MDGGLTIKEFRGYGKRSAYRCLTDAKVKKSQGSSENACYIKRQNISITSGRMTLLMAGLKMAESLSSLLCSTSTPASRSLSKHVLSVLEYLFMLRDVLGYIYNDNGPEFIAEEINERLSNNHVQTLYIESGSSWKNGYIESFSSRLCDDLLDRELFYSVAKAKVLAENWRLEYNNHRPHSVLGYMTPATLAASCIAFASPAVQFQQYTAENVDNSLIECVTEFGIGDCNPVAK